MSGITPEERRLQGKKGAAVSWGNTRDRSSRTANGRAAAEARFLEMADGDPVRAAAYRDAFYADLALRSVRARRLAKQAREAAAVLEAEAAEAEAGLGEVA